MQTNQLELLCCPECNEDLELQNQQTVNSDEFILYCNNCSKGFVGNENYIDFMGDRTLDYNGRWDKMIRTLYAKIYTPATNAMFLLCGGVRNAKKEVLDHLEIEDGQKVLETGVGAAENFYLLNKRAKNLSFYGNDIQNQMLVHSIRNLRKWNLQANLYRSDAQFLPFEDESFEVVFHLGSINLFPNKERAIHEMIRVAKPGTKIVIADESQKAGKLMNLFTGSNDVINPPMDLIPKDMIQPSFKTIWRGYGYLIEFRKPFRPTNKTEEHRHKAELFSPQMT